VSKAIEKYSPWKQDKNEIVVSDVVDGKWQYVNDPPKQTAKKIDDWDAGVHENDFHDIPAGLHGVKMNATDMAYEREWNFRRQSNPLFAKFLIWAGLLIWLWCAVSLGITKDWTAAVMLTAAGRVVLGAVVFFSGAARMEG
jgi:hypothetical protein